MNDVSKREGAVSTFGQSPFALARGQSFEAGLLSNGGERILAALRAKGVIPEGSNGVLDLRQRLNRGPMANLDQAIEATKQHLVASAAEDRASRPKQFVIAGAALCVPGALMLPEAVLVVDLLVVRRDLDLPLLVVGEVKTYPDRGGYTDRDHLATARAQAGVYAHGLELTLQELGLSDRLQVSDRGFLVLSKPGSNMPSVRPDEDLRYQIERARRGFDRLRTIANGIGFTDRDPVDLVQEATISYCESCISFCERSALCRERATLSGDPAVLGREMAHWLGGIDLNRALELLDGASPGSPAERDLLARLHEAGTVE